MVREYLKQQDIFVNTGLILPTPSYDLPAKFGN